MATSVIMPKMGESIQEGKIIRWLKKTGDPVKKDEILLEISTDKVDTEVPSPASGVMGKLLFKENDTVAVGTAIAEIETSDAPAPKTEPPVQAAAASPKQESSSGTKQQPAAPAGEGIAIVMPKMGESIQEGKILKWHKKVGDIVKKDETLLEISTDKVDTEVPAPASGVLSQITVKEMDTVAVGTVIGYIGGGASSSNVVTPAANATPTQTASRQPMSTVSAKAPATNGSRFYSPLVRTIAKNEHVATEELERIPGSGASGRVTKTDILSFITNRGSRPAGAPSYATQPLPTFQARPSSGAYEVVPMDNMRQKIAEHMVASSHISPHVSSMTEVDMTRIVKLRAQFSPEFLAKEGFKLTYTPFFIKACVRALQDYPAVNSSVEGTNIIFKKSVNFGVAVALPEAPDAKLPGGLIVPVIKNAEEKNLVGIARAVNDLATRARSKKLLPDDIQGGTFTLTNPGIFGNLFGTPIINQPQVAIMGTGAIVKRPVVIERDGEDTIAIRPMMYLSMSYDHRIVDGMLGTKFMARVKEYLENFEMVSL